MHQRSALQQRTTPLRRLTAIACIVSPRLAFIAVGFGEFHAFHMKVKCHPHFKGIDELTPVRAARTCR